MASPARAQIGSGRLKRLFELFWKYIRKLLTGLAKPAIWWWKLFRASFAAGLAVLLVAIASIFFGSAVILRVVVPRTELIISPFEISDDGVKLPGTNGKSLANIFVDEVQKMIEDANSFSGNAHSSHRMYSPLPTAPHIPVQTTFGIAVEGVSLDQIVAVWHHVRYVQYLASGDLIVTPKGAPTIYVRYQRNGEAKAFELKFKDSDPSGIKETLRDLAVQVMFDLEPELPVRYFVTQALGYKNKDLQKAADENFQKAIDLAGAWAKKDPKNPRAFFYLGYGLDLLFRPADGILAFDRAIELDQEFELALHGKAFCQLDLGRFDQAIVSLKAALQIGKLPFVENNWGMAEYNRRRFDEAIYHFRQAIKLDPTLDAAYSNLGRAFLRIRKNTDATVAFGKARRLNLGDYRTLAGLATALVRDGKADTALNEANLASLLDPAAWQPGWVKGIIALEQHDAEHALKEFKAVEKARTATLSVEVARAYRMQGNQRAAKLALQKALTMSDQPELAGRARAYHLLGVILAELKDPEAKRYLDRADSLDPLGKIDFPLDE